jgi:hypothetical protein
LLYDLQDARKNALQRVRKAIAEMNVVLQNSSADTPARILVAGILKRLRCTEACLQSGIKSARKVSK